MSMSVIFITPDGKRIEKPIQAPNGGDATPVTAQAYADHYLRDFPIGTTWSYAVRSNASYDWLDPARNPNGERPKTEKGN